jgi:transposase-like protein
MLGFIYREYIKYLNSKTNALVYIEELNKLEKFSTLLNCSYCNETNVVTFLPEEVPNFTCTKCQNINNVKLTFTVARVSTPTPSMNDFNKIISEPQQQHNIQL